MRLNFHVLKKQGIYCGSSSSMLPMQMYFECVCVCVCYEKINQSFYSWKKTKPKKTVMYIYIYWVPTKILQRSIK